MKTFIALTFAAFFAFMPTSAQAEDMQDMDTAILRGLDKVSGRIQTFETGIDQTVRFGKNLFIRVRACRKSDPIDTPESAAFMEIWQKDLETEESHWIFSGWMFASSPALSAMDHPVYDVWVIDCKNNSTSPASSANDTAAEEDDANAETAAPSTEASEASEASEESNED